MTKKTREKKERRYGPRSFRDQATIPRGARIDDKCQLRKNRKRALPTCSGDRYGFNLMWRVVPDMMVWAGVRPWGHYDPNNSHKGRIWGWKSEMPLNEKKVQEIVYEILERKRLTMPQLEAVRKALSYAWQLKHGCTVYTPQKHRNWNSVKSLYATIVHKDLPPVEQSTLPTHLPTYQQLEDAFTREWHPEHPMTYLEFESSLVCAYDTHVFGLRSNEDCKRVKNSQDTQWHIEELYMRIGFVDGRCKLAEKHRPWGINRVCFCEEGKHVSPTEDDVKFRSEHENGRLNDLGNPHPLPFESSSCCPLWASQFISLFANVNGRPYPKLNKAKTGFTTYNIADPVDQANKFFIAQGVTETPFSHNAGRKALGILCEHNNIPYELSFEIHADEFVTFKKHYSFKCFRRDREEFTRRTQHENPLIQCAALRMIANGFGRGPIAPPPPLTRMEKYMHEWMAREDPVKAETIRTGRDMSRRGIPKRPDGLLLNGYVPKPPPELTNSLWY